MMISALKNDMYEQIHIVRYSIIKAPRCIRKIAVPNTIGLAILITANKIYHHLACAVKLVTIAVLWCRFL